MSPLIFSLERQLSLEARFIMPMIRVAGRKPYLLYMEINELLIASAFFALLWVEPYHIHGL